MKFDFDNMTLAAILCKDYGFNPHHAAYAVEQLGKTSRRTAQQPGRRLGLLTDGLRPVLMLGKSRHEVRPEQGGKNHGQTLRKSTQNERGGPL